MCALRAHEFQSRPCGTTQNLRDGGLGVRGTFREDANDLYRESERGERLAINKMTWFRASAAVDASNNAALDIAESALLGLRRTGMAPEEDRMGPRTGCENVVDFAQKETIRRCGIVAATLN